MNHRSGREARFGHRLSRQPLQMLSIPSSLIDRPIHQTRRERIFMVPHCIGSCLWVEARAPRHSGPKQRPKLKLEFDSDVGALEIVRLGIARRISCLDELVDSGLGFMCRYDGTSPFSLLGRLYPSISQRLGLSAMKETNHLSDLASSIKCAQHVTKCLWPPHRPPNKSTESTVSMQSHSKGLNARALLSRTRARVARFAMVCHHFASTLATGCDTELYCEGTGRLQWICCAFPHQ